MVPINHIAVCPLNVTVHEAVLLAFVGKRVSIRWANGTIQMVTRDNLRDLWVLN